MGNRWPLKYCVKSSVYRRLYDYDFVFNESTGNLKEDYLVLFFMNYGRASAGNSLQYLICLKSKCVYIFLVLKRVKFGFRYIFF